MELHQWGSKTSDAIKIWGHQLSIDEVIILATASEIHEGLMLETITL